MTAARSASRGPPTSLPAERLPQKAQVPRALARHVTPTPHFGLQGHVAILQCLQEPLSVPGTVNTQAGPGQPNCGLGGQFQQRAPGPWLPSRAQDQHGGEHSPAPSSASQPPPGGCGTVLPGPGQSAAGSGGDIKPLAPLRVQLSWGWWGPMCACVCASVLRE